MASFMEWFVRGMHAASAVLGFASVLVIALAVIAGAYAIADFVKERWF